MGTAYLLSYFCLNPNRKPNNSLINSKDSRYNSMKNVTFSDIYTLLNSF